MKKIFTIVVSLMTIVPATVQAQVFDKGDNIVSIGFGLGSSMAMGAISKTPLISLQFDRGILDIGAAGTISLGGYLGYKGYTLGKDQFCYSIFGIRGAYHLSGFNIKNTDLYSGIMAAYDFRGTPSQSFRAHYLGLSGADVYHSKFDFTPFIGARFFISERLAVVTEVSYGASYLSIGLACRL